MGFLGTGIQPSLIHGVEVIFQRLDAANTVYDPVYKEPVNSSGPVFKAEETILAQIHYKKYDELVAAPAGDDQNVDGWITALRVDIDDLAGGPLKKGDKIVSVDGRSLATDPLFIVEPWRAGHYTTSTLWKFFFKTRGEAPGNSNG